MANRYWVGGTGTWNASTTTRWSSTSGGSPGASPPTTADDVFFDANSNGGSAFNVTIGTGAEARSINCTGFTRTITGSGAITVAGSVTLVAGMTYTHTGTMTFTGTGTLTTAGKTFSAVTVDGSGITLTLGDALNISTRTLTVTQGTFDTANYNVTAGSLSSDNSNTRTITLGSSTLSLSGANAPSPIFFPTATNLTFNANTSQINCTNVAAVFQGGSQTFHNVSFTSTSADTRTITGANTFNDLSLTASATGLSQLSFSDNQTVNGTFTCAGTSVTQRAFVRSNTIGTTRTITAAVISADDCDFGDITIAGAASPISPTRAGDCGGNTNITFPAAKTVYRVGTNGTWAGSNSWALTSGGTGSNDNFPLAQDTAVIDNATTLTTNLGLTVYNIGTLDASARTNSVELIHNAAPIRYGSYILGSGITVSGTNTQTFSGRGTMTFTSAGKTITFPITVDTPGGTFQLGDAFSGSQAITLTQGTFDANDYNLTFQLFNANNSNTKTVTMGSGLWTLSGTGITVWQISATNLTFNKDTADILLSATTTGNRSFGGGGLAYNKLTIGGATGTSTLTISGNNTSFTELASIKTVAHTIELNLTNMSIDTWSIAGTAGNVVTVDSSSAGTRRTFTLTNVTSDIDYLDVKDIGVTDANRFYVGANSTDSGNNLNVIFTAAPGTTVNAIGEEAMGEVGTIALSLEASVPLMGEESNSGVGTVVVSLPTSFAAAGLSAVGEVGTIDLSLGASVPLMGEEAVGEVGTIDLSLGASVPLMGEEANTGVGSVVVSLPTSFTVTGLSATASLGSFAVLSKTNVFLAGTAAQGLAGTVNIWEQINDAQTPNWIPVVDSQTPNWTNIPT
jgi:hypothetical protein